MRLILIVMVQCCNCNFNCNAAMLLLLLWLLEWQKQFQRPALGFCVSTELEVGGAALSEWQSMGFVRVGGSSCLLLTTCPGCVSGAEWWDF